MYLWSHFYYLCIWSHWPFSLEIEGAGRNSRTTPLTHHCLLPTTSSVESKTTYIFLVFIYVRHHVTVGLGWTLLLRGLRTLGYGIVCYDWLGCGGSEKPDCRGCTNQGGVTWPWSPIDLRTCSTPHHVFFCVFCLCTSLHSWNSHSADQLEVAGNCAMVSSLFLSSRSLCLCFNQDDWYAYAFDELLKDLIAIWQDLRWPGPYIAAWLRTKMPDTKLKSGKHTLDKIGSFKWSIRNWVL